LSDYRRYRITIEKGFCIDALELDRVVPKTPDRVAGNYRDEDDGNPPGNDDSADEVGYQLECSS